MLPALILCHNEITTYSYRQIQGKYDVYELDYSGQNKSLSKSTKFYSFKMNSLYRAIKLMFTICFDAGYNTVFYIHSDTIYRPDYLQKQLHVLTNSNNISVSEYYGSRSEYGCLAGLCLTRDYWCNTVDWLENYKDIYCNPLKLFHIRKPLNLEYSHQTATLGFSNKELDITTMADKTILLTPRKIQIDNSETVQITNCHLDNWLQDLKKNKYLIMSIADSIYLPDSSIPVKIHEFYDNYLHQNSENKLFHCDSRLTIINHD